jgi:uncharacterized protein (TIGR03067 family)
LRWVPILVALLSLGCGAAAPGISDRDRIQGNWKVVRYERGGAADVDDGMLGAVFSFADDRLAVHTPAKLWAIEEGFWLEPHHNPPRIIVLDEGRERDRRKELPSDWINQEETLRVEQGRDRTLVGAYRFNGDNQLTLCFIKGSHSPPWRLDSGIHRDCILMMLEKESERPAHP